MPVKLPRRPTYPAKAYPANRATVHPAKQPTWRPPNNSHTRQTIITTPGLPGKPRNETSITTWMDLPGKIPPLPTRLPGKHSLSLSPPRYCSSPLRAPYPSGRGRPGPATAYDSLGSATPQGLPQPTTPRRAMLQGLTSPKCPRLPEPLAPCLAPQVPVIATS